MPQLYPVNANTMNYAGPIMGATVLISGLWYFVYGVSPPSSQAQDYDTHTLALQWRTYKPASALVIGVDHTPKEVDQGSTDESEKRSIEKH